MQANWMRWKSFAIAYYKKTLFWANRPRLFTEIIRKYSRNNEIVVTGSFNRLSTLINDIEEGYSADILFWDIDNINEIPYWFNSDRLSAVMKKGKLILENNIN